MLQPSREHFRSLSQKFVIKAKCFSWQNLLKYHSFYSLQNKAISKARLPYTIDLGSTTGTRLGMYHRKHTHVTHCPHLPELEKLYPEHFFTRIISNKICCRDFHRIFRIHWRATQELTLQEVWGLHPVTSSHSCINNPLLTQSTAAEGNALTEMQCGLWGQQNKHTTLFTDLKICIPRKKNHTLKKNCLVSQYLETFTNFKPHLIELKNKSENHVPKSIQKFLV